MAKVMVVDDNNETRAMLADWLGRKSYTTVLAANGPMALALVKAEKPDLVLVDLNMPILDGFELTQQLRGTEECKNVPIIAVTARVLTRDRTRAIEVGCDEYEPKPVNFARLGRKIEELLARKKKQT